MQKPTSVRSRFFPFCVCLLVVGLGGVLDAKAQTDTQRAAAAGELTVIKNQRVLRLFGDDLQERGFAHGYLLGEDIRTTLEAALQSLPHFGPDQYDGKLMPFALKRFAWNKAAENEMEGMFEGLRARLGSEGLYSKLLGRALTRDDLKAMNALGDYFGPACSAFSAWDKRTVGGAVIHARTLDFPLGPEALARQVLFASEPWTNKGVARHGWVAVGWPGFVGQYTGMNDAGLVACIHDAYNNRKGDSREKWEPRSILLRRMLEEIDPAVVEPAEYGAKMAKVLPASCGNLFHLTWPRAAAEKWQTTPSAVLEFDASERIVAIRRMDASETLVVANHFVVLNKPVDSERFTQISAGLELLRSSGTPIGLVEARKLLMAAEQTVAAHSVYFYPDTLELHVALTRGNVMSPRVVPTAFTFKELLKQ